MDEGQTRGKQLSTMACFIPLARVGASDLYFLLSFFHFILRTKEHIRSVTHLVQGYAGLGTLTQSSVHHDDGHQHPIVNSRRRGSIGLGPLFSLVLSSLMLVSVTFKLNMQLLHEIVKNCAILQLYQHEDSDCGRLAPAECHLQAGCGVRVAYATRLRLRQVFSRTLRSPGQ